MAAAWHAVWLFALGVPRPCCDQVPGLQFSLGLGTAQTDSPTQAPPCFLWREVGGNWGRGFYSISKLLWLKEMFLELVFRLESQ